MQNSQYYWQHICLVKFYFWLKENVLILHPYPNIPSTSFIKKKKYLVSSYNVRKATKKPFVFMICFHQKMEILPWLIEEIQHVLTKNHTLPSQFNINLCVLNKSWFVRRMSHIEKNEKVSTMFFLFKSKLLLKGKVASLRQQKSKSLLI